MGKKKINPRRIPMAKSSIDRQAITEEATRDNLKQAWIVVASTLVDLEYATPAEIPTLSDAISKYITKSNLHGEQLRSALRRGEELCGLPYPYANLHADDIRSEVELTAFKRKVKKIALHTAFCVICLGLEGTGRYTAEDLRKIFFSVDLTQAEIERGITSYEEIENSLEAVIDI